MSAKERMTDTSCWIVYGPDGVPRPAAPGDRLPDADALAKLDAIFDLPPEERTEALLAGAENYDPDGG